MSQLPTAYFISGLGADKRAFQFLDLDFCNPVFVDWIPPLAGEHISSYAARIKEQIPGVAPIIVGLSFGGMVGAEIARQFQVKKLILISSAKTRNEIPFYLKWLRYVPLHRATSIAIIRKANHTVYRYMGIEKRSDKILFEEMLYSSDDRFMKWAINQIINWNNKHILSNAIHIHGNADILLPHKYVNADHIVESGEHLMVMTKGPLISKLLKEIVSRIN